MPVDNTNSTFDARLDCVRISCEDLQGNIMKMGKGLHFSTDKFLSVIDTEEFGYTLGNSDVISEQIDGIGSSERVLVLYVTTCSVPLSTITKKYGSPSKPSKEASDQSIRKSVSASLVRRVSVNFSEQHIRRRKQSKLKMRFLTGNSKKIGLGVNCTAECMNKTDRSR